ncbi:MAG TPA: FtsX-like permease family protein [Thermomicrobiales bacterium]|jgi:putative ABC transport system permease protein|nr:FtsX-like permease family protein [Thermomicrobiales bacterium]
MNEIFGISMDAIMVTFVIMLVLCLSYTAWIALRQRVVFRLGMRNIPRRKAQTALIVVGLMLSTLISTAALGMGDTIDRSLSQSVYGVLGEVDELVYPAVSPGGDAITDTSATLSADALGAVDAVAATSSIIDGVMPALYLPVPVVNDASQLSTPENLIVGIDPTRADQFGGLRTPGGEVIDLAAVPSGQVVISEGLSEEIDAAAGDQLTIYYANQPVPLTVAAVAENSPLSGVLNTSNQNGMVVRLDELQRATGMEGLLSFIAVSNVGNGDDSIGRTDDAVAELEPALSTQPVAVNPIKQDLREQSALISSSLTGLFLVLGLFSIAVGVLLIVLIFSMLAAERRAEMGMARAVGQQRRHLIQQFIAEGSGYALLSGLVGAAAGTLVILGLAQILKDAVGDFFDVQGFVSWRSIVVGYCLGVIMTFLAIVVASFRASRLNVVAAIRDLPDREEAKRRKRTLVTASLITLVGVLLIAGGVSLGESGTFLFYFGMSLVPLGLATFARWFGVPSRLAYSLVGLYLLLLWFLPAEQSRAVFGEVATGGDFEMFFLIGIFSVAGTTMLITQNLDILLALASRIGSLFGSRLPAVRLAIAYPGANVGRTGLTIAMFSLIVFSLVAFSTVSANFSRIFINSDAGAGYDVQVVVQQANQIPDQDIVGALNAAGADTSDITAVGTIPQVAAQAPMRQLDSPDPGTDLPDDSSLAPLAGFSDSWLENAEVRFQARAAGYPDDAAIINALRTEPDVAVVDAGSIGANGGFPGQFLVRGFEATEQGWNPIQVAFTDPTTGESRTLRVIGVIDQDFSTLFGVYVGGGTAATLAPEPNQVTYTIALADPDNATDRAREIGSALLANGAVADSYDEILEENQGIFSGFLLLIQGFMGLGLIVGIAAVGVIAFRAVIERRQQIGVLRAIGYARSMVSLSFMIETAFVVGLGVISGTILALVTAWQLFQDPNFTGETGATGIVVPWGLVLVVLAITFGFAMLMTWVPSRQAASIRPAEALRYE